MSCLQSPVLVLNKNWMPIHIRPVFVAISDVISGSCEAIDHRNPNLPLHGWESWSRLPITLDSRQILTTQGSVMGPEIIVHRHYRDVPALNLNITRKNILLRDNCQCQYCGKRLSLSTMTIDHVVPRSRGGGSGWSNVVSACRSCNCKKSNRSVNDFGKPLLQVPKKPKWHSLTLWINNNGSGVNSPDSWKKFISI